MLCVCWLCLLLEPLRSLKGSITLAGSGWVLLLLLSHFSRVRLCGTPWTAAYQAPSSMGFSSQEHWSGVPLPSPGGLLREAKLLCFFPVGRAFERGPAVPFQLSFNFPPSRVAPLPDLEQMIWELQTLHPFSGLRAPSALIREIQKGMTRCTVRPGKLPSLVSPRQMHSEAGTGSRGEGNMNPFSPESSISTV